MAFESLEIVEVCKVHKEHIRAAQHVGSVMQDRICMDDFI